MDNGILSHSTPLTHVSHIGRALPEYFGVSLLGRHAPTKGEK